VSNQTELERALDDVRGGDTILLEAGRYAELIMTSNRMNDFDFGQRVTIASADASNQAQVNQMFLRGVSNVEFRNIEFHHNGSNAAGTDSFRRDAPFFVESSDNIVIDEASFQGDQGPAFGEGIGLRVKESRNVTITDSEFADFLNGMNISNSDGLTIARNVVRGMANDGMTFGGVTDVLIEDNVFRNFRSPEPDSPHKDNIQFRIQTGEHASKNVVIRNNEIYSAEVRHGIYFGNELVKLGDQGDVTYENIVIQGNYISSAQTHGITVFHGNGIYILDNVVEQNSSLGFDDEGRMVPRINVSRYSDHVEIRGNEAISVPEPQNWSWTVAGNDTGGRQLYHWDGTEYPRYNAANYGDVPRAPDGGGVIDDGGSGGGTDGGTDGGETDGGSGGGGGSWEVVDIGWDGRGDELRINGVLVDGADTRILVDNLDIRGGDELVLNGFGDNTFDNRRDGNPLPVWDGGAGVRIDHMLDFHELDAYSNRVSTRTENGDLILRIEFHRGVGELVFDGLGAAFNNADPLGLY
jgi:hypothetical protein